MLNVIKHVDQRLAAKNLGVSCLTSILEQSKNENSAQEKLVQVCNIGQFISSFSVD